MIAYPLTPPASPLPAKITWNPKTIVGMSRTQFTGQQKVFAWPGQWWEVDITLPPMKSVAIAEAWNAFLLSLNGPLGTFWLGDSALRAPQGTLGGTPQVGAGAAAGSTTLPIQSMTGSFTVGDWLQVGNYLHKVVQVNAGSVDVFPVLRAAYAQTTAITTGQPKGLFRLTAAVPWTVDNMRVYGLSFGASDVIP